MPAEPCEASLDDPIEPCDAEGLFLAFDDHKPPAVPVTKVLGQTFALVASVGDHGVDLRPERRKPHCQPARRSAIGDTGWFDPARDKKALGIDEDLALAPFYPLVAVEAANTPLSVVFTD